MTRFFPRNWRTRGRLAGLGILLAAAVSANTNALARTGDVTFGSVGEAIDFTAVQIAARAHLDQFFGLVLNDNGVSHMGAALRIAVPRANAGHDYLWVTPFQRENNAFIGLPHDAASTEPLRFDRAQVVDWSFTGPDGRLYGNFTTRLFLQNLTPEQAESIAAILSETPAPKEWLQ